MHFAREIGGAEYLRKSIIPIDAMRLSLVLFAFVYFLMPDLVFTTDFNYNHDRMSKGIVAVKTIAFVSVIFIISGCFLGTRVLKISRIRKTLGIELLVRPLALVLLLSTSFVALLSYARSFGGLSSALAQGALLRYARESVDVSDAVYGLYFVPMAGVYCVMAQCYSYASCGRLKLAYVACAVLGFLIIILYGLICASRGAIFIPVLLLCVRPYKFL